MTTVRGSRIELWVEERDGVGAVNPTMRALLDALTEDGASVAVVVPELEITGPDADASGSGADADLVLLKSATSLGLSRAMAAERRGATFLNGAMASWRASDKAAVVARLAAAGLPVPDTYLTTAGGAAGAIPVPTDGAWVSKPVFGVHGRGVSLHQSFPDSLPQEPLPFGYVVDDGSRLVQRRVGEDGGDIKVYVAGGRCFAGRKAFHADSFRSQEIERVALPPAWTAVVLGAGETIGLVCFGVDLRERDGEVVIIDVNPFPGFRGFPGAVAALRSDVEAALVRPRP